MTRGFTVLVGSALAALAVAVCFSGGLWERQLSMDNRLYFYIAERAASGVSPHVSTPDVKNQLSTLADSVSIRAGRLVGLDDARAGRLGTLAILIVGIWGVGCSVYALGATAGSAALAALSVFAFSNLTGHTAVGFNPKILLFTLLAWGPWFLARESFGWGGAIVAAAMLSWQPAASACLAAALGSLASRRPVRAFLAVVGGGVAAFALYEAYFASHGAMLAQLFQAWGLPLGSVHDEVDWLDGLRFVMLGSRHGIDALTLPGTSFFVFTAGALAAMLGLRLPASGRALAPAPAVTLVAIAGSMMVAFSMYEHQAEPDRFLLVAYFAIALGVVADRVFHFARTRIHERTAHQLQGALAATLLMFAPRNEFVKGKHDTTLDGQIEAGHILSLAAEAYGGVWAYGCIHLMGLAHETNFHPIDHFWDDLRRYVDEDTFVPVVRGRMPDVIMTCRRPPGGAALFEGYVEMPAPKVAESMRLFVRSEARASATADESLDRHEKENRGLWKRRAKHLRT